MRHELFVLASVVSLSGSVALAQGSDSCASPEPISGLGQFAFATDGATTDGAPAAICNFFNSAEIYNDVWFCWTAETSGLVTIGTCGASFDTKLAVYDGCTPCPGEDVILACNDDACSLQSRLNVAVVAGQSYTIRVGSYSTAATGSGDLNIESGFLADVTDPGSGVRYVAVNATTWTAAEALAQSLGGHLVSIGDEFEQEFVWSTFGNLDGVDRRVWIGFNDVANEGAFEWSDGSRVTYTNWNGGEPNNANGTEHYTELLGSSGKWNDMPDSGGSFPHIAVFELPKDGGGGGPSPCPADLDNNDFVDAADLGVLLGAWGPCTASCIADLDDNSFVDAADLGILLGGWGQCPR